MLFRRRLLAAECAPEPRSQAAVLRIDTPAACWAMFFWRLSPQNPRSLAMRFAFFGKFVFSCVTLVHRVHCERAAESPVAAAFKTVPLALAIGSSCVGKTQSSKNFFAETRDAAWPTLADGATCGEDDFFVARNDARNVHMFGTLRIFSLLSFF